jgi:hypothetical protein
VTGEWILPEHCLRLRRQTVEPLAQVGDTGRQPYPGARRQAVHRSSSMTCRSVSELTSPRRRTPRPTAKGDLDDAVAIRPPRPIDIHDDFDWHHGAAFHRRLRQQLPPPSEQLVAVHIVTPRHDRHRRTGRLRFRHHLALQRFGILSTLRLLSVHYAASGHLFCLLRHPPIIAPIGVQR